jgi:hypothetical protein
MNAVGMAGGMALLLLGVLTSAATVGAQESTPQKQQCEHSHDGTIARGNSAKGMGFDAAKTTHHFRLSPEGGSIEVTANDAVDTKSRDEIRMHLGHIAKRFQDGDFDIPMFVHDQTPPGVPAMKRLKSEISYKYEETDAGGRVLIATKNAEALAAVHDFLRFQIREHHTGDPTN